MTKKFENKKLNKEDHVKVDKEADIARNIAGGAVGLGTLFLIKKVLWKEVEGFISKMFFKA